mmetsp:Transcript_8539/g.18449  ORF Transcript_8539/g.18449 Transcript_8539/m.18449 type:complete len:297 (+) Transcript_8539:146-1036(+)
MKAHSLLYDILFPGSSSGSSSIFDYSDDADDDEEASLSSTVSSWLLPPKQPPLIDQAFAPPPPATKKQVSFHERANEYHDNHLYCQEDAASLWLSVSEYQDIKRATSQLARAIHQAEGGALMMMMVNNNHRTTHFHNNNNNNNMVTDNDNNDDENPTFSSILHSVHLQCSSRDLPSHDDEDDDEDEDANGILTPQQTAQLVQLYQKSSNNNDDRDTTTDDPNDRLDRIGLERRAIKPIASDKTFRRQEMIRVVYQVQFGEPVSSDMAHVLRRRCRQVSRPSRWYAQCVARAQAAGV